MLQMPAHAGGDVGEAVAGLAAACGAAVPQTAGRGLGHTGGTLDKMETIPGWRSTLSTAEVAEVLRTSGAVINAAGPDLAPADRKLYALRDITGTVESIPLIASSIMSKKIAEGTDALVLDVKFGSGAFLPDPERGRELARTMVGLGTAHGVRTTALLTAMEQPLGRTAGNAVEVEESVEVLAGGGPADLVEVTLALAREMVALAGLDVDPADALADGRAMDRWRAIVAAQGGDPDAPLPVAAENDVLVAESDGVVQRLDRPVSGVIVFARTSKAAARLSEAFKSRAVEKLYWGVSAGEPQGMEGTLEQWLLKDHERNLVRALATDKLGRVNALRVIMREAGVGLLNGLVLSVLMAIVVLVWFGSSGLGMVIAAAMIVNLMAAALAGILIPLAFHELELDPAPAAGVFVTMVTDVVGFFAFLGLASIWLF